jgi:hypothetical protein
MVAPNHKVITRSYGPERANQGRFARSVHGQIYSGPGHDYRDHPSGRFILRRNAL